MNNIIIFCPSFENGGVKTVLMNLINHLSKKKKIFLITNKKSKDFRNIKNLKIISSNQKKIFFINDRILSSFFSMLSLAKILSELPKKGTIIFSMQSSFFAVILCFFQNYKINIRISEDPCGATKYADNKIFAWLINFTKLFTYNFSSIIFTNASKSQKCVKNFVVSKNKVKLLYNPTLKKILKKNRVKKRNFFLNVGRYTKQKNQKLLIKAFSIFCKKDNNYKLLIFGQGPNKKALQNYIYELGLQNKIELKNWTENLSQYYDKAKIFISTSLYEGMPNALIEAINHETPSITTNVSGADDILINGKGGEIIKSFNEHELAHKINYVLKNYKYMQLKTLKSKKKIKRFYVKNAGEKYIDQFVSN